MFVRYAIVCDLKNNSAIERLRRCRWLSFVALLSHLNLCLAIALLTLAFGALPMQDKRYSRFKGSGIYKCVMLFVLEISNQTISYFLAIYSNPLWIE